MTLYLIHFNNYYNRQVKFYDSIDKYPGYLYIESGSNLNFNPNDGVNTTFTAGRAGNPYYGHADYCIITEPHPTISGVELIVSRWFIIEQKRNLKGQYTLQLRRDVLVDYYNQIITAPTYIEKATLRDDNPLIYNSENISVNRIKTEETLLKDYTGIAWIVGYLDRKYDGGAITINANSIEDETVNGISNWSYYSYVNTPIRKIMGASIEFDVKSYSDGYYWTYYYNKYGAGWGRKEITYAQAQNPVIINGFNMLTKFANDYIIPDWFRLAKMYITNPNSYNDSTYSDVLQLENRVIKDSSTNKFYKVSLVKNSDAQSYDANTDVEGNQLHTSLQNKASTSTNYHSGTVDSRVVISYDSLQISLQELAEGEYKLTFPNASSRLHLKDAPYDMFCIPCPVDKEINISNVNPAINVPMNKGLAISLAQGIAEQLGKNLFDLQLLPFCPMTGLVVEADGDININTTDNKRVTVITNAAGDTNRGVLLWSLASQGTFNIPYSKQVTNKKLESICDTYRLCSPNYNGQFEFDLTMNDGVDYFNVDYTYLPYTPYIHINPNFKGLFGKDFDDARGLIIQGDFSICYLSDAWVNYVNNNKNYLNIFNREVDNMKLTQQINRIQQIVGGITGSVSAGVNTGLLTGNPIAGIAGGILSAGGAIADIALTETLNTEALNYKTDMFEFQKQNIQAMPSSIAKTTAYTNNNKIFPILEYYTCTETEKEAVANKIAWNGMTVGVIDQIQNYINNSWSYKFIEDQGYIKGRIIRIDGIQDDFHLLNAISDEIYKGGYFK